MTGKTYKCILRRTIYHAKADNNNKRRSEKLQDELEDLRTNKRKEVSEALKEARTFGDLSENSEYDEAKDTQSKVENRIAELEEMIKMSA